MTNIDSRKTYGLLSKTILQVLANEDIDDGRTFAFLLYMEWGIIMACPESNKIKLIEEILLRQTEKIPENMKNIFIDNKSAFMKIYKQAVRLSFPADFAWYTAWVEHCKAVLKPESSMENCFELFVILKDCMGLSSQEQLLSITIIHETLLYVGGKQISRK